MKIAKAQAFRYGAMGSSGDASGMILGQWQFPEEIGEGDRIEEAYNDRIWSWYGLERADAILKRYGTHQMHEPDWFLGDPKHVLAFLVEMMKLPAGVDWNGWRVLGYVNRSNRYPVYLYQVVAMKSDQKTHTGRFAPNMSGKPYGAFTLTK